MVGDSNDDVYNVMGNSDSTHTEIVEAYNIKKKELQDAIVDAHTAKDYKAQEIARLQGAELNIGYEDVVKKRGITPETLEAEKQQNITPIQEPSPPSTERKPMFPMIAAMRKKFNKPVVFTRSDNKENNSQDQNKGAVKKFGPGVVKRASMHEL